MVKSLITATFLFFVLSISAQAERRLTIGVSAWPSELNFLTDKAYTVSEIYRELTQSGVVRENDDVTELVGLKSFRVGRDGNTVELVVNRDERLANGRRITAEILFESLSDCPALHLLQTEIQQSKDRNSVRVVLKNPNGEIDKVISALGGCPIFDGEVARRMGSSYGTGTNIAGLGNFAPVDFRPGRSVEFHGGVRHALSPRGVDTVFVKSVDSAESGLAALRLGNIDLLVTNEQRVFSEAKNDPTLRLGSCGRNDFVVRTGLYIKCDAETLRISEVKYE